MKIIHKYLSDIFRLGITNSDPRWVGNWWLGFIVSSVPLFFLVIPMSGFSRDIPGNLNFYFIRSLCEHIWEYMYVLFLCNPKD